MYRSRACFVEQLVALAVMGLAFVVPSTALADAAPPSPLLVAGAPVKWWFVYKFNSKTFPGCGSATTTPTCIFGETPPHKPDGQQFVYASSKHAALKQGSNCLGDTATDPVRATFSEIYSGSYHFVIWNDQFKGEVLQI